MYVILSTHVRASGLEQLIYGPFKSEKAAKAAIDLLPARKSHVRKVAALHTPGWLEPLTDDETAEADGEG